MSKISKAALVVNIIRITGVLDYVYDYRVVQKTYTQFYFWDNFGNSAPVLTILSMLQAEIYGA